MQSLPTGGTWLETWSSSSWLWSQSASKTGCFDDKKIRVKRETGKRASSCVYSRLSPVFDSRVIPASVHWIRAKQKQVSIQIQTKDDVTLDCVVKLYLPTGNSLLLILRLKWTTHSFPSLVSVMKVLLLLNDHNRLSYMPLSARHWFVKRWFHTNYSFCNRRARHEKVSHTNTNNTLFINFVSKPCSEYTMFFV